MGEGYTYICFNCGYNRDWLFGEGILYHEYNLTSFKRDINLLNDLITSKKEKDKLKELFNEKDVALKNDYGYKVYICRACDRVYNRFYLDYEYEDGNYEVEYICSNCKKLLEPIMDDDKGKDLLDNRNCPKCENRLFMGAVMNWD